MKKTVSWVCGNVDVTATIELPEGTPRGVAALAAEGITQVLQRKPSSAWEKSEAGYEKRPEGFKRNSIPYSEESAERLIGFYRPALAEYGVQVEFETTEHIANAESSPMARATAFVDLLLSSKETESQLRSTLSMLGMENAMDAERDELIKFAHSKGLGVQKSKK